MKKNILIFLGLFILALGLRLWGIQKPDGLWNDEYMAWWISSFDFGKEFFTRIFMNCHMPLYYLFLKVWAFIFGNSDTVLRLSSVFVGMLNIISLYFLGKEYKSEKTGLICALFGTLSGFLIYFSQEVRLYGLIFLISTWIAFFFVRASRELSAKNLAGLLFFNFLLIAAHTIGFVFVFFNLLIFSILTIKKHPETKRTIFITYAVLFILCLPLLSFVSAILTRDQMSQNWGFFNFSKIWFVLIDYLTPLQTNITNSALNVFSLLKEQGFWNSFLFIILPFVTGGFFTIKGLLEQKELKPQALCGFLYFVILLAAAIFGKLVLSTKYSVEIYPVMILLFACGVTDGLKWGKVGQALASAYFSLCLIFLIFNPQAPQKLPRTEGHRAPVVLLNNAGIGQNDYIISLYHQFYRYEKYSKYKPNHLTEIDKASVGYYLMGNGNAEKEVKHNGKAALRETFITQNNQGIIERVDNIYKSIPSGKKVALIIPAQVAFFSSNDLKRIASSNKDYQNTQIMFMAFSYAKIQLINEAFKFCNFETIEQQGSWIVMTFTKN